MAARHIRAVQKRRREFTDQLNYEILCILATDTGRDDSPARTGYRNIAERAGCHFNTVGARIDQLEQEGWLSVQKSGKYHYYTVNVAAGKAQPIEPDLLDGEDCNNDYDNEYVTRAELAEVEQRLSQQIEGLSQRLSQIVTTPVESDVTEDKEDKEDKTPPSPPENDYLAALWGPAVKFFNGDQRKATVVFQAQRIFCEAAKIKHPYLEGDRSLIRGIERDWWGPLAQMLSEANGDLDQFGQVIGYVVQEADRPDGFTLSSPKSAVNTFRSIVAQMARKSYRPPEERANGNGANKGALLQAIRNAVFRQYGQRGYKAAQQGIPAEHWRILNAMGRWENFFRMNDQDFDIAFYQALNSLNGIGQYAN